MDEEAEIVSQNSQIEKIRSFQIEFVNRVTGKIALNIPRWTTSLLKSGRYVYDVEITQTSSGTKTRVIEGQITVYPQVTST